MKKFLIFLFVLLVAGAAVAYYGYNAIFSSNVELEQNEVNIKIKSGSEFDDVLKLLKKKDIIQNDKTFTQVSQLMKYGKASVPTGSYMIQNGWSNRELIGVLRSGRQTPVKITFNNLRKTEDLAGKISSYLEMDSLELLNYFNSTATLEENGFSKETFLSLFIPNTYEVFWNISKDELLERMRKENEKFWSKENRMEKAEALEFSKEEVYTMASLVEKETLQSAERLTIAGLYINRIKRGMLLQADPTVVYALNNFELRRVLYKHLEFDSPYNTYIYPGLPPGPICMPSIASIDAVLNYEKHNYVYFCAKPESNGGHLFAENIGQHNANARVYHRWLDQRNIR